MFLRISVFTFFLASLQSQAADSALQNTRTFVYNVSERDRTFELEVALCAPDCPNEVISIISIYRRYISRPLPSYAGLIPFHLDENATVTVIDVPR
jgi:hypothetical protein